MKGRYLKQEAGKDGRISKWIQLAYGMVQWRPLVTTAISVPCNRPWTPIVL
jgi:hypothetical protein